MTLKKILFVFLCFVTHLLSAQKAKITWGDEFKLKKGSTDLEVVFADQTGIYVKESHLALKSYFVIGATTRESATLIKLDKSLTQVYDNNYNKELKGKEYEKFVFLKNKLFILASDYNKKDKTLTVFGAEIDKNTGDLASDWKEIVSWSKESSKEDIYFNTSYNEDSTKFVLASTIEGREKNNYEITLVNEKLTPEKKGIKITNEFEKNTYEVENIVYTLQGNIAIVAREFEYQEGKKKKAKFLDFKNYNIRLYDNTGKQISEINTAINGKWLNSAMVRQLNAQELVLAAFYSNTKKGREINGMLVQRINSSNGAVLATSDKPISTSLITAVDTNSDGDEGNDDESKKERKEREKLEKIQNEDEGFSRYMRFRSIINTPDNGLVILAEEYNSYIYTTTNFQSGGAGGFGNRSTTTTYKVYELGDLLMSKIDNKGTINWLHMLPKNQREVITLGTSTGPTSGISFHRYFDPGANWPFYAGFGVIANNRTVSILFNDHKKNDAVLQMGQKVKRTSYFGKSNCYAIDLDINTGKYTRNILFDNDDVPTAMPRLGRVVGNDFYLIGKQDRILSKSKIAIAKLTLK